MQGAGPDEWPAGEPQSGRVHTSMDALPGLEMRLRATSGRPPDRAQNPPAGPGARALRRHENDDV